MHHITDPLTIPVMWARLPIARVVSPTTATPRARRAPPILPVLRPRIFARALAVPSSSAAASGGLSSDEHFHDPNRHVLAALVQNEQGVLARVATMFAGRGFNIDSLVVGRTEVPELSRMTIVVSCEESMLNQVRTTNTKKNRKKKGASLGSDAGSRVSRL